MNTPLPKNPTLTQVRNSPAMLSMLCARMVSIRDLIGINSRMIPCPFHKDDTPSAKFHEDPDAVRLWCFGCGRMYSSYHYLKKIEEVDVFNYLMTKFGKAVLENECRMMDFVESRKKAVNVEPAIKVWKETKDVTQFLDTLYTLRSDDH